MTKRRQAVQVRQDRPFKGRQFTAEVILWAVRWYLMFPISYRDLELMLLDRGVEVDHTTISRWIQAYAAELEKRIRPHLRMSNGSWRVDETYVRVKGRWMYLYRAVDIVTATSASIRESKYRRFGNPQLDSSQSQSALGLPAKTKRVKPANERPPSERRVALFWLGSKLDNGALWESGTGPILKNDGLSVFSISSISRQSFERHDGISVPMVAQPVRLPRLPALALFWGTELAESLISSSLA